MMHWRSLDTAGKIEAVRQIWQPGITATRLASNFDGASRNAVIGLFHRHAEKMQGMYLGVKGENGQVKARVRAKRKSRTVAEKPVVKPRPKTVICGAPHTVGRPLGALPARRCKFAVTPHDVPADKHLFCGLPAEGSYCDFHRGIVWQPKSALNERAKAA